MITNRLPAHDGHTIDAVFLTFSFVHEGIGYRAVVAEHSHMGEEYAGETGYHYHAQSDETF